MSVPSTRVLDSYDIYINLQRWDKNKWKLDLATRADTQDTIHTPEGTIVDHVKVPGFSLHDEGLQFKFLPLGFGSNSNRNVSDQCLEVRLRVDRESSYYDRNIIPLLASLNTVAVCLLALVPDKFGYRGECILAIAFVEIGIRLTVDSRLPVVGYQIKMQWVLNNFFFGLLFLVAESSVAYLFHMHGHDDYASIVDRFAAIFELSHMVIVVLVYFIGSGNLLDRVCFGCFKNRLRYE